MSTLNEQDFLNILKTSSKPVLVDFWAEWCGPCRALAPVLEEIEKELGDKVKIVKINVDHNQAIASQYGIRSIPTLILFKDSQICDTRMGSMNKTQLVEWLKPNL